MLTLSPMNNNLLSESLNYTGGKETGTRISMCRYSPAGVEACGDIDVDGLDGCMREGSVSWFHIAGLSDEKKVGKLCEHFCIDRLVVQDVLNASHPSKVEMRERFNVIIAKLCTDGGMFHEAIIQGPSFVLTFSESSDSLIVKEVLKALDEDSFRIRSRQSDYLMAVLLNGVVAVQLEEIGAIDSALDDLESDLLEGTGGKDVGARLQLLRRRYLSLKQAALPLKEQYPKLMRSDSPLLHEANRAFFADVGDHISNVAQKVDICRETLSSLVDLYIANNDLRMNDIMKSLTVVSTIFIPLTFLVGVWGMNFEFMPELSWKWGYPLAWVLMVLIGIGVYVLLKVKKWG